MSTFTAEPSSVDAGYDIPTEVQRVVDATRHLCDFRAGLAQALGSLAESAVARMPDEGQSMLEPLLRALGADRAGDYARRLYTAACKVVGHWDPDLDTDAAAHALERLTRDAAHAVADEVERGTRICCNATRPADREPPPNYNPAGGIQL